MCVCVRVRTQPDRHRILYLLFITTTPFCTWRLNQKICSQPAFLHPRYVLPLFLCQPEPCILTRHFRLVTRPRFWATDQTTSQPNARWPAKSLLHNRHEGTAKKKARRNATEDANNRSSAFPPSLFVRPLSRSLARFGPAAWQIRCRLLLFRSPFLAHFRFPSERAGLCVRHYHHSQHHRTSACTSASSSSSSSRSNDTTSTVDRHPCIAWPHSTQRQSPADPLHDWFACYFHFRFDAMYTTRRRTYPLPKPVEPHKITLLVLSLFICIWFENLNNKKITPTSRPSKKDEFFLF